MPYAGTVDKTMGAETVGHLKHLLETELKRAREENDLNIAMFLGVDGRIFSSSIPNRLDPRQYRLLNLLKGNLAHICNQLGGQNMMMSVEKFGETKEFKKNKEIAQFLQSRLGALVGPGPLQEIVPMAYNEVGTTASYMTAGHWDRFVTIIVEKLRDLRGETVAVKAEKEWRAYLKQVLSSFV